MRNDWINIVFPGGTTTFSATSVLECQYQITYEPLDEIHVVETSVMWYTTGKGNQDIGVHFFKRLSRRDLRVEDLNRKHRFQTVLPPSPLSYEGEILQINWCVRVKLFLPHGRQLSVDLPFEMKAADYGRADEPPAKRPSAAPAPHFEIPRRGKDDHPLSDEAGSHPYRSERGEHGR